MDIDLEAAYEAHASAVIGFATRFMGRGGEAEDIAQEAFARLVVESRKGLKLRSVRAWLLTVTRNLAVNRMARRKVARRHAVRGPSAREPERPEAAAMREETRGLLTEAIDRLGDDFRAAVLLCDVQGLSYEEAAEVCQCNVKTISSRLSRARKRLRDQLSRTIFPEETL